MLTLCQHGSTRQMSREIIIKPGHTQLFFSPRLVHLYTSSFCQMIHLSLSIPVVVQWSRSIGKEARGSPARRGEKKEGRNLYLGGESHIDRIKTTK